VCTGVGWGPNSPPSTITTTGSSVEITGSRTREERDSELLKHAVDVEDESQTGPTGGGRTLSRLPQPKKRVKRE
jgi:hypothetical protein